MLLGGVMLSPQSRQDVSQRMAWMSVLHMINNLWGAKEVLGSSVEVAQSAYLAPPHKMEGVNVLAVNYGSPGACQYHRQLRLPVKWSFNSHTVLKYSEQAPRTPTFSEDISGGEIGEDEGAKPLERSFWAKYWMCLIPLVIIVMNAFTQAMNMPEEQAMPKHSSQLVLRVQLCEDGDVSG